MRNEKLIVYGGSGHGRVVADAALAAGFDVLGFADDNPAKRNTTLLGMKVIAGGVDEVVALCRAHGAYAVVGIGNNQSRQKLYDALMAQQVNIATVVHPSAVISKFARIGRGTVIFANVAVNCDTIVGNNVILNTGCTVDHDNAIGDHVHLSPGVHLGGTVTVGEGTHVGIGASVRNNLVIGAWSVIGAGSAVVKNVADRRLVYGVPAMERGIV